jgi:DNA-directed RNA polymerase specialized sigma24 family protein
MEVRMLEAHQQTVDFKLLQKGNGLLAKWSEKLGTKKKEFLRFCFSLQTRLREHKASLPKNLLCQFCKDMKVMSYAQQVEEELIKQYTPMVFSIVRKLPIQPDQYEDLITEGLMAVRSAVWYYRQHQKNASFTTFCHCSITKRIKWYRSKQYKKQLRRNKKAKVLNCCDLPSDFEMERFNSYMVELPDPDMEPTALIIEKIIKACELNEEELFLIKSYVGRGEADECWYKEYNRRYTPKTRQGVHYQLNSIQRQMLRVMRNMDVVPENFRFQKGIRKCWTVRGGA